MMPLTQHTARSLAHELESEIARLPGVAAQLAEFFGGARREVAGIDAIVASLSSDPALVAWILRQANSGHSNQQRTLTTLPDAAVVLGLETVTQLTFAAFSRDLLLVDPFPYPGSGRSFWLHGMAAACAASSLARKLGARSPLSPEAARIVGLIHDVGKRLVADRWPASEPAPRDLMHERRVAGFDHATASAAVAHVWGLPDNLIQTVAEHHASAPVGGAALLAAADHLLNRWLVGPSVYPRITDDLPLEPLVARLGSLAPDSDVLQGWVEDLPPVLSGLDAMLRWAERPGLPEGLTSRQELAAPPDSPTLRPSRRQRRRRSSRSPRARRQSSRK